MLRIAYRWFAEEDNRHILQRPSKALTWTQSCPYSTQKPPDGTGGDGSLAANPINDGRTHNERADSVASFTGSAFRVDANRKAQPLLALGEVVVSIMLTVARQWDSNTPRVPVGGWYQGAASSVGEGRVTVFGEAATFTAQLVGPERRPVGMTHP
jgi:hypothetical protein